MDTDNFLFDDNSPEDFSDLFDKEGNQKILVMSDIQKRFKNQWCVPYEQDLKFALWDESIKFESTEEYPMQPRMFINRFIILNQHTNLLAQRYIMNNNHNNLGIFTGIAGKTVYDWYNTLSEIEKKAIPVLTILVQPVTHEILDN